MTVLLAVGTLDLTMTLNLDKWYGPDALIDAMVDDIAGTFRSLSKR